MKNFHLGKTLPRHLRGVVTHDGLTFDSAGLQPINKRGDMRGKSLGNVYTMDGGTATFDSTGAFLVGELERLDPTINLPLSAVTWGRDVDVRTDVTLADEFSSFMLTTFGTPGNLGAGNGIRNGKSWAGKATNQASNIHVDVAKIVNPLTIWLKEVSYTIPEIESAAKMGRPIDTQKIEGLQLSYQMETDEMVYVGDAQVFNSSSVSVGGLLNSASVTNVSNVPLGASGFTSWATKTPPEKLSDVNALLQSVWAATGFQIMPTELRLPPTQYGDISTQLISVAGASAGISILKYLKENNVMTASTGVPLNIQPIKWLVGAGVGGTIGTLGTVDRMIAYTKEKKYVRYPMTLLQRTPVQYDSIYHKLSFYCRLGVTEIVYPETVGYRDGI